MLGLESTNAFRSNERNLMAMSRETMPSITSCGAGSNGHILVQTCMYACIPVEPAYSNHILDMIYSGSPQLKFSPPGTCTTIIIGALHF